MDKVLLIRATSESCDALLFLNGVLLGKLIKGRELCIPIHEFVQAGENRIQIQATAPLQGVFALAQPGCSIHVHLRIELQKDRGPASFIEPTVLFDLSRSHAWGQRLENSLLLDAWVELPVKFPRWCHFDIPQTANRQNDLQRIQDFMFRFLGNLSAGNVAELLPLFSARNMEIADAYRLNPDEVHLGFKARLTQLCSQATLLAPAFDAQSWLIHSMAGSPVHALLKQDFQPLLQFILPDQKRMVFLPLHVAVIGHDVFVVR